MFLVFSIDGNCECKPGYTGTYCEKNCPEGSYGLRCASKCTCNVTGTAKCTHINGSCQCRAGYQGRKCEKVCDFSFQRYMIKILFVYI